MKDWKQILYDIYSPEVGSIWAAPNGIWTNLFASNKSETDYHPSVVGKVSSCKTNCQIVIQQNLLIVIKCFEMVAEIFSYFTHDKLPDHSKESIWFL